jgi:hypothetical protein
MPPLNARSVSQQVYDRLERAIVECEDAEAWIAALRSEAGRAPYEGLRSWALEQTAERSNEPLWERLEALGVRGPEGSAAT